MIPPASQPRSASAIASSLNATIGQFFDGAISTHLSKMQRAAGGLALLDKGGPLVAGQARLKAGSAFDQRVIEQHADVGVAELTSQAYNFWRDGLPVRWECQPTIDTGARRMDLIDDAICRQILEVAATRYPRPSNIEELRHIADGHVLGVNAHYLEGEGLAAVRWRQTGERDTPFGPITITQKGVNHLRGDGGLAAREQVLIVKLHDDSLKALLELAVQRSPDVPQNQKDRLSESVRALPAETTKHLALQLVDAALANVPAALQIIGRLGS